jgi:hypothetical protein
MKTRSWVVVVSLALLVSAGCSKKTDSGGDGESAEEAPTRAFASRDVSGLSNPDFFSLIPADSPIVLVGFERVPRDFVEKIADVFVPLGQLLQEELSDGVQAMGGEGGVLAALLGEIDGRLSLEGFESLGFRVDPRVAMYMIGSSLALRVELSDGKKLEGVFTRIEKAGDIGARKATLEGVDYRTWTEDSAMFVFAIIENEAVIGIMHQAASAEVLPVLLGLKKPAKSIADTGAIRDLVAKYGYVGVSAGYIDLRALARMFTGEASALSGSVLAATGMADPDMSDACKKELSELAEVAPRMVYGYTSIDAKGAHSLAVLELRSDIARDLSGLQTPVPGLAKLTDGDPLFAMGMGLDLAKTLAWSKTKASAIAEAPYQCEWLDWMNEGAVAISEGLDEPLPPMVGDFKGFALAVQDVKIGGMMPSGTGYAIVGMENPMAAIDMAKGAVPQLSSLKVSANGKPVEVDLGMPGFGDAHIAVKGKWLGASLGPGMSERMTKLIRTKPAKVGPFAVMAYDYGKYMELLGSMMQMDPEGEAFAVAMKGISGLFGMMKTDFYLTGDGLVMKYSMAFR